VWAALHGEGIAAWRLPNGLPVPPTQLLRLRIADEDANVVLLTLLAPASTSVASGEAGRACTFSTGRASPEVVVMNVPSCA
jgi:hypothetical protein